MRHRLLVLLLLALPAAAQPPSTYAERLGWKPGARVIILHMDDAGMSWDSDEGIERVLEHGAARSLSVMMPCPWVPQMVRYILAHPGADAGLHLTLTSEWRDYRWGPLAGASSVPGLADSEGALWPSVEDVVRHATPAEIAAEMRAQLARAERMGFHPTHLDTHMGTVYATPAFLDEYVRLGLDKHIPVMVPGGHDSFLMEHTPSAAPSDPRWEALRALGRKLWDAGLPVLDDLHNVSYDWRVPPEAARDQAALQHWKTARYIDSLSKLKPGLTMVIMHCTAPTPVFAHISASGPVRESDMLAMLDPDFRRFLDREGFIVTTWREAAARRTAQSSR